MIGARTAVAAVALLLLSGCSADEPASGAAPSAVPSPALSAEQAAPSPAVPSVEEERVDALTAFASPTGNILCVIERDWASCTLQAKTWRVPPRPASCDTDYGPDLLVGASGKADFRCSSDAAPYDWDGGRTLAYGRAIRFGDMRCQSDQAGMLCESLATGHGFTVSRAAYSLR